MKHYGAKELAASFRTVRKNTLLAARDIPEDQYDYSPAEGFMTVEKLLTHIAISYRFQHQVHAVEKLSHMGDFDWMSLVRETEEDAAKSRSKAQVIELLEQTGVIWASFLEGLSDDFLAESVSFPEEFGGESKSRFEMILSVKEHEMHHRGQLMLIQRLLGIVPHLTREREARRKEFEEAAAS
ncbi:MAG: DinB family protein [Longimicrobiales bacterium]|nr:DinB family protein [Longimicrobiales bacterium]